MSSNEYINCSENELELDIYFNEMDKAVAATKENALKNYFIPLESVQTSSLSNNFRLVTNVTEINDQINNVEINTSNNGIIVTETVESEDIAGNDSSQQSELIQLLKSWNQLHLLNHFYSKLTKFL